MPSWRKLSLVGAALGLFALAYEHAAWPQTADEARAMHRIGDEWAGINPDFVVEPDMIRPGANSSDDFRDIRFASAAQPPGAIYAGSTCLSHYPGPACPVAGQCTPPAPDDEAAQRL